MIKFIIYDESRENKKLIYDEIDKEMMKSDIEYLKEYITEFNTLKKINDEYFKIYIPSTSCFFSKEKSIGNSLYKKLIISHGCKPLFLSNKNDNWG